MSAQERGRSNPSTIVIRMPELVAIVGLARPTIYKRLKDDPTFPRPVPLTDSSAPGAPVGWLLSEVQAWVGKRVACRTEKPETEIRKPSKPSVPLRDLFAGKALQGLLANAHLSRSIMKEPSAERSAGTGVHAWHAEAAYQLADAMLAERDKAVRS